MMDPRSDGDKDRVQQGDGSLRKEGPWHCLIVGWLLQQVVDEGEAMRWKARGQPPTCPSPKRRGHDAADRLSD